MQKGYPSMSDSKPQRDPDDPRIRPSEEDLFYRNVSVPASELQALADLIYLNPTLYECFHVYCGSTPGMVQSIVPAYTRLRMVAVYEL